MDWGIIAQLIIQVGIPAAEKLIQKWENNAPVTLAEFQEIRNEANQTAKDRMTLALKTAGIDPASEQGKALLGLTDAPPVLVPPPAVPAP